MKGDPIECKLIEALIETMLQRDPMLTFRQGEALATAEITGKNVCEIVDRSVFAKYKV